MPVFFNLTCQSNKENKNTAAIKTNKRLNTANPAGTILSMSFAFGSPSWAHLIPSSFPSGV